MYPEKIKRLRHLLAEQKAAGAVLTGIDNVLWATGYISVMDGWHLPEPMSGVFIPTDADKPITLMLPEASLIGLIVSERGGYPVHFERLGCFDLLNFCETARAEDAFLQLGPDIEAALNDLAPAIVGPCQRDIIASIEQVLPACGVGRGKILFDDLRIAAHSAERLAITPADGYETIFRARSIKTAEERALFLESGKKADRVMDFTAKTLGIGKKWCDIEKAVAHFMIDEDIDPLPSSPMLFGGSYDLAFRPDLFRTHFDQPFEAGQIAILETQGRYKNIWMDINRTAHMGAPSQDYLEQHATVRQCFEDVIRLMRPGANTAEICHQIRQTSAKNLDSPGKLHLIIHTIGHVPLETPNAFPFMGLDAATDGFTLQENMVVSFDCLYFGSKLGPSHMENVFLVSQNASASIYNYPLDLIVA